MAYNTHNIAPYPTRAAIVSGGANAQVIGQALTVTSTATSQFSAFNASTEFITFDVQTANVYATFGGETPASGTGHILTQGNSYTWSKAAAAAAKFVATTTTNSVLYASEFQT